MAKAEQLVRASGTASAKVTVLAGGWDPGNPVQAAGRHFISILDQLGYRASLRVILDPQVYTQRAFDSRAQAQIGEFSWFQDFPAPSASMIRRYIIWRNNHAYDERLRRIIDRANVA